jgi:hypothetical protein
MIVKECKIDFEKIKELVKSSPEVECTGRCYGCQAMCINRIPKLPEETVIEILSFLKARKLALEIQEKLPEETVKELVSVLEVAKSALEKQNDR